MPRAAGGCSYSAPPATPLDALIAAQGDDGAQSPCSNPIVLLKSNLAHIGYKAGRVATHSCCSEGRSGVSGPVTSV